MTKSTPIGSIRVIADGVEFNVWRELSTFITWGHMMSADAIRFREANVISYKDQEFLIDYSNRKITIDARDNGVVPDSLVQILKDVAHGAVKQHKIVGNSQTLQ